MDTPTLTDWLTAEEIGKPLSHISGEHVRLSGPWAVEQFRLGQGDGPGVWRVSGFMNTPGGEQAWSLVLKGWTINDKSVSPSAFDSPIREAELYRSGVLDQLLGVSAPSSFGSVERQGYIWTWLEDLTPIPQPPWTLNQYSEAARNLGRFNGAYLAGKPLPNHQNLSKRWLAGLVTAGDSGMSLLQESLTHPLVRAMFPEDVYASVSRLWERRQALLDELDAMPRTFCHLDAFHQNIFFRRSEDMTEMLLVDWAFAGLAAPGEELAALCVAGVAFDPRLPTNLEEIERVAFDAYIEGLLEAGSQPDRDAAWRAYRIAALLRYGPANLYKVLPTVTNDAYWAAVFDTAGVTRERGQDHLVRHYRWIAEQAEHL